MKIMLTKFNIGQQFSEPVEWIDAENPYVVLQMLGFSPSDGAYVLHMPDFYTYAMVIEDED